VQKDVFVSHAWEDKADVVDELVRQLNTMLVTTWYDTQSLRLGDSLREKIDEGIGHARAGVVVLSPSFFSKSWPKEELDGLFTRTTDGGDRFPILPVWHNVTKDDVARYSPILAGKLGVSTSEGVARVASRIAQAVGPSMHRTPEEHGHRHVGETVRLVDIPSVNGWVQNHYFSRCVLQGPAVLAIENNNIGFKDQYAFFTIREDRGYLGFIGVRDCTFVDCVFDERVGFAVTPPMFEQIMAGFGFEPGDPNRPAA
jgi:hypothetical protein